MQPVTMYTTGTCPYCLQAKKLLAEYGVTTPTEIRVDLDPSKRDEMMTRTNGGRSVPQIFIGERYIGGFDKLSQLHSKKELENLLSK